MRICDTLVSKIAYLSFVIFTRYAHVVFRVKGLMHGSRGDKRVYPYKEL